MAWNLPLARTVRLHVDTNAGGTIRIFGVSLLAVAAIAAARLLWKRREEEFFDRLEMAEAGELEELRVAGL